MADQGSGSCLTALSTSLALIDQFQRSLQIPQTAENTSPSSQDHSAPLQLLKTAAEALKSSVTKLSLLCLTPPFTPSAVTSIVKPLSDSILPSLVTATLLTTPAAYPDAFCTESKSLTTNSLADLKSLLHLANDRAQDGRPKEAPSTTDKKNITEATGKVWEGCDSIINFANKGVPGFVTRKAEQWLALMKDAVQELQEWDPEEEVDEHDLFGDVLSDDEEESDEKEPDPDRAAISAGVKDQALTVLSRIPQSIHVVIKQRLAKLPHNQDGETKMTLAQKTTINRILKQTRSISENIDESAEGMYMGNLELCLKKAGEARATTIDVVQSVLAPWNTSEAGAESKEDVYVKRALLWIQQVDAKSAPASKSPNGAGK